MLGSDSLIAFVTTRDLARSARFYSGILDLPLLGSTSVANIYRAGATELRVTLVPEMTPAPYATLGWRVRDIAGFVRSLKVAGVGLQRDPRREPDELAIWTAPDGSQVVWFSDPDGNMLTVQQPSGIESSRLVSVGAASESQRGSGIAASASARGSREPHSDGSRRR